MTNVDQSWLIMSDREEFEAWADDYGFHDGVTDVHKYAEACAWDAWQAACAKRKVPEGWKLAPITPTDEMIEAGRYEDGANTARVVWAEMIAAAPQSKEEGK